MSQTKIVKRGRKTEATLAALLVATFTFPAWSEHRPNHNPPSDDFTTLSTLNCDEGQIAKVVDSQWVCAADEEGDINTDTLDTLGPFCNTGDVAVWDGQIWNCAPATAAVCVALGFDADCDLGAVIALRPGEPSCDSPVQDQSSVEPANNSHTVAGGVRVAQTFTQDVTGSVGRVDVQVIKSDMFGGGTFGPLILEVLETSAGFPTTVLASATLGPEAIPSTFPPPLTSFLFPANQHPVLTAGEVYAIQLRSPDTNNPDSGYVWRYSAQAGSGGGSAPDSYTAGQMFRDLSTGSWTQWFGDAVFATYRCGSTN